MKPSISTHLLDQPALLIVGVQTPQNRSIDPDSYFQEFRNLVRSDGFETFEEHMIKLRSIDSAYFFTRGKLDEIIGLCKSHTIGKVIISEPLSHQQTRNLTDVLEAEVMDRTELILEIFEKGAQSSEGKLQVAVALLNHKKARVAGKGIHLSQQAGSIGTRGPGETQKEKDLRHLERLISKLDRDLEHLSKVRETQRKKRSLSALPHISIIGYTNAGKSTLLNALTKSSVYAENKLFATLDTTTRELFIDGSKKGTVSDTVGFIQNLPHELIEAFKSTLSDLEYAHMLLQVVDLSDKNWRNHIRVVQGILDELKVSDTPMLYVFNKVDMLNDEERKAFEDQASLYQPHVLISALSKEGLQPLLSYLREWKPS
ncbi:TPA: GTPase HflX [Candidatus Dependentiae bacterium]|nr:MAG: GTPase HflX [candidate division TM6 bacterium GW2011_GWF2_43_87]HBL98490.1 GTPase HflX [Candidatus Dependentiae bacterium]